MAKVMTQSLSAPRNSGLARRLLKEAGWLLFAALALYLLLILVTD